MTMRLSTVFAMTALTLAALIQTACPGPTYPACATDSDCKAHNEYCVNKQCQQCRDDTNCTAGQQCKDGRCVAKAECTTDADCGQGKACQAGKCVAVECTTDQDCPAGKRCDNNKCVAGCSTDEECGAGMKCQDNQCVKAGEQISSECQPTNPSSGDVIAMPTIHFDFDKHDLKPDARSQLDQAAKCMQQAKSVDVVIYGYCDDRGTQEYNLGLGDRRANAVKDYLHNLGIDTSRMRTVSKGENDPVCRQETEECWAKNRRVEFVQKRGTY